jgi:predicted nucleic acid-binding Zn ribbon protein
LQQSCNKKSQRKTGPKRWACIVRFFNEHCEICEQTFFRWHLCSQICMFFWKNRKRESVTKMKLFRVFPKNMQIASEFLFIYLSNLCYKRFNGASLCDYSEMERDLKARWRRLGSALEAR